MNRITRQLPVMEIFPTELQSAQAEWQAAQKALDEAQGEFVEVAVLELAAAEKRYDALIRLAKKEGVIREAS